LANKRQLSIATAAAFVSLGVIAPCASADAIQGYNITDLSQRLPIGINNQGQVGLGGPFGFSQSGSGFDYQGQYPSTVSIYSSVGSNAGMLSAANTSGAIPGGGNGSTVPWVNDAGNSTGVDGQLNGYVSIGGVRQQIGPTFAGDAWTDPRAINNSGQVVGDAMFPHNDQHAFLYSAGMTNDLGTLGGRRSMAEAINDSGTVVGWAEGPSTQATLDGWVHAFVYRNGTMTDLTPALGKNYSYALGINSTGAIVGSLGPSVYGPWHAFLLDNGKATDLNSLLPPGSNWTLVAATGINDLGQIIGSGIHEGAYATFLLTPASLGDPPDPLHVPEPGSILCFAAIMAGGIARRAVVPRRGIRRAGGP
jgi:probable HAF family extracellular repeat protein